MSEDKGILSRFFHIGAGTVLSMAISFITTPIITRLVNPSEYGRLSIFNLYIGLAVMILCLGLDQTLVRYYYKQSDCDYKSWVLKRCSFLPIVLSFVVPILLYLIINVIGVDFDFSDYKYLLLAGIVGHMLYRFSVLGLRLEEKSKSYARVNVINKLLFALIAIALIVIFDDRSFNSLAIATVSAVFIASVIAIVETSYLWFRKNKKNYNIPFQEFIKYGAPFIVALGLTTLFEAIDKLALKYFCDYTTIGIYTGALNIVNIFAILQTTFNTVWAPLSVKHYESDPGDRNFFSKYNLSITVIMFSFGFMVILFKNVLIMFLGEAYRDAVYIIPFLTLHPIMYTISETTVTGLVVANKSNYHIITAGSACITNILGNIVLVPIFGAKGAAISTGISYIVFYALRTIFGMKFYSFNCKQSRFIVLTIIYLIFALINTFYNNVAVIIISFILSIITMLVLYKAEFKAAFLMCKRLLKKNV